MVKKNLYIYILLSIFLIITGCYVGPRRFIIPKENFETKYNKIFDTAIAAGAANGFHVIHEDRRLGIINLEDAGRGKDKANIDIQFFKAQDGNYIGQIQLRTSTGDPILGGLQSKIRDSIQASMMKAAGVSGTESKQEGPVVARTNSSTTPVSFLIEAKTPDEQAIVQMLEMMINAYNDRNIDKHIAFYSPEAKVDSLRAGGVVSRDEYRTALLKSTQLPRLELKQTKITLLSSDSSGIEADIYSLHSGKTNIRHIFFDLIRREGQWFISRQQYK